MRGLIVKWQSYGMTQMITYTEYVNMLHWLSMYCQSPDFVERWDRLTTHLREYLQCIEITGRAVPLFE